MPYIKAKDRPKLDYHIDGLGSVISNEGDLNYAVTRLCKIYVNTKGEKYSTYNTLVGALECIKLELYRKQISIYEEKKENENGSIK